MKLQINLATIQIINLSPVYTARTLYCSCNILEWQAWHAGKTDVRQKLNLELNVICQMCIFELKTLQKRANNIVNSIVKFI
jgi:hypothetical protein